MTKQRIVYCPQGVCSKLMIFDIDEEGVIRDAQIVGGCNGNGQGLCILLKGMKVQDAIDRLHGIDCGGRGTSCPDQVSIALSKYLHKP